MKKPYSPECVEGEFSEVELPFYGVLRSASSAREKVSKKGQKKRMATQNSSGIHQVLVLVSVCMRIRALARRANPS